MCSTRGSMEPEFHIEGGRLTVKGELGLEDMDAFGKLLRQLIDSGERKLEIDLSALSFFFSFAIGPLAAAIAEARADGRSVTILASPEVAAPLKWAGIDLMAKVRAVKR